MTEQSIDGDKAANQGGSFFKTMVSKLDLGTCGPLIALGLLLVFGAMLNPTFVSIDNLENVLSRSAFIGIITIGATFVINGGGIYLSVGSMAAFSAAAMIVVINYMVPIVGPGTAAIAVGVVAGYAITVAAGLFNGTAITAGRIEPFIVTLGMMGILRSLVTWFADGGALTLGFDIREVYRPIYFEGILGVGWPVIVFLLMAVLGEFIMRRTVFGLGVICPGNISASACRSWEHGCLGK